jgi:hypothetical protein
LLKSSIALTPGYVVTDDKIGFINDKGIETFLSSRFNATARTRELDGTNCGFLIEVPRTGAPAQKFIFPGHRLADGGKELASMLMHHGAKVATNTTAKERLSLWVQFQPEKAIYTTTRVGWHDAAFVLPDGPIVPHGADEVFYCGGRGASHRYIQRERSQFGGRRRRHDAREILD